MATDGRKIGAEVATVALIAACLIGTTILVVAVHRRSLRPPAVAIAAPPPPAPEPEPEPTPEPEPVRVAEKPAPAPTPPPAPVEDPTPKVLASLAESTAREREEANRLDRRAEGLERGRKTAEAEAESWRRREMLVRQQLAAMDDKARKTAREIDAHAAQRDVLARERDALKAAIAAAPGEGSYAVLPYRGENGTWRRPIVIECTGGQVSILPDGPAFTMLDLTGLANPRSSPVVVAIAGELLKVRNSASPDGSPVTPYFMFLVRPDGVRSYYEVRSRLEPLGISFGYELVDADMKIHVPDYDNVASWDGSPTLNVPAPGLAASSPNGGTGDGAANAGGGGAGALAGGGLAWPGGGGSGSGTLAGAFDFAGGRKPGTTAGNGNGNGNGGTDDGPEAFVWPSGPSGEGRGGGGGETDGPVSSGGGKPGAGATGGGGSPIAGQPVRGGTPGSGIKPPARDVGRPEFARRGAAGTGLDRPGAGPNANAVANPGLGGGLTWGGGTTPVGVSPDVARGYREGGAGNGPSQGKPSAGASTGIAGDPPRELALGDAIAGALGSGTEPRASSSVAAGPGSSSGTKPSSGAAGSGAATGGSPSSGATGSVPGSLAGIQPPPGATAAGLKPPPIGMGLAGGGARIPLGSGSSGGMPVPGLMLGGESESSRASGGSGGAPSGDGESDGRMAPLIPDPDEKRPRTIEAPFEIVVACGRDGVTIQPGNRRITTQALKNRRDEELLIRNLEAEARRRALVDPAIKPMPRVRFLVQEDGAANFWEARRQLLFAGLNWPMTLQVAGVQNPKLLDEREIW